jgi:hypothetical protein
MIFRFLLREGEYSRLPSGYILIIDFVKKEGEVFLCRKIRKFNKKLQIEGGIE